MDEIYFKTLLALLNISYFSHVFLKLLALCLCLKYLLFLTHNFIERRYNQQFIMALFQSVGIRTGAEKPLSFILQFQ